MSLRKRLDRVLFEEFEDHYDFEDDVTGHESPRPSRDPDEYRRRRQPIDSELEEDDWDNNELDSEDDEFDWDNKAGTKWLRKNDPEYDAKYDNLLRRKLGKYDTSPKPELSRPKPRTELTRPKPRTELTRPKFYDLGS
jgi:hypothetical protein